MGLPNNRAIFNASTVEGVYLLLSIEFIVCRDTPTCSASSACVMFFTARSMRILFFMTISPGLKIGSDEK